jgi:hypothetical protein
VYVLAAVKLWVDRTPKRGVESRRKRQEEREPLCVAYNRENSISTLKRRSLVEERLPLRPVDCRAVTQQRHSKGPGRPSDQMVLTLSCIFLSRDSSPLRV